MKVLMPLLLMSLFFNAFSQEKVKFKDKLREVNQDELFSYIYKQNQFKTVDVQGDVSLCKSIVHTGMEQVGTLAKFRIPKGGFKDQMYEKAISEYPQYEIAEDLSNPYDQKAYEKAKVIDVERALKIESCDIDDPSKVTPFSAKSFAQMIEQVIFEEKRNFKPTYGEIHRWSKGFKLNYQLKCPIVSIVPKMLLMLATGVSYRFAYTGKEEALAYEIENNEVRSLYPHDIFRMSYRLNKGDVYLALLTIENLFSRHWTAPKRESKMVTTRLANITNDLKTDNFGTWYHLFGVMTFGYAHGSTISWGAGFIEGIGSGVASGFKSERQENKINRLGARIGGKIKRFLNNDGIVGHIDNKEILDPENYLNLLELSCNNLRNNSMNKNNGIKHALSSKKDYQ